VPVAWASLLGGLATAGAPEVAAPDSVRVLDPSDDAGLAAADGRQAEVAGVAVGAGVAVASPPVDALAARAVAGIAARRQITAQATAWPVERPYRLLDHRADICSLVIQFDRGEIEFRGWRTSGCLCQVSRLSDDLRLNSPADGRDRTSCSEGAHPGPEGVFHSGGCVQRAYASCR